MNSLLTLLSPTVASVRDLDSALRSIDENPIFILALIVIFGFFLPFIIASLRDHKYKWIILVLNIFGFTGVAWVIALIWAIYPSQSSLIDPIVGNTSGIGTRNAGDTLGEVEYGMQRGYVTAASGIRDSKLVNSDLVNDNLVMQLEKLSKLHASGALSDGEFQKLKNDLLSTLLPKLS